MMDEFCVGCGRKLFVAQIGVEVVREGEQSPGDALECPECHHRVVSRFGSVGEGWPEQCALCERDMCVAKTGQEVLELTAKGGRPYKLLTGNILRCPECDYDIVAQFDGVIMQHDKGFGDQVAALRRLGYGLLKVV